MVDGGGLENLIGGSSKFAILWSGNGKEIFYCNGDKMMKVELSTAPEVRLSPPRLLFEQRYAYGAGITIANYEVTRDDQRFIMVKDESNAGRLNIILNRSRGGAARRRACVRTRDTPPAHRGRKDFAQGRQRQRRDVTT